jgi:putative membrane protein (TIGR04086 family)
MSKTSTPRRSDSALLKRPPMIITLGALVSMAVMLILFTLFAVLTSKGILPEKYISAEALIISFIASLIGARNAMKRAAEKKFIFALGTSASLYLFFFAVGRAISGEASVNSFTLKLLLAIVCGGAAAGLIKVAKKDSKARKH